MVQPAPADVVITIIGAGIAGLSLGWKLASAGADVTILEKNLIGSGASSAAGAYLEPRSGKGKLRALEWQSLNMWPEFADDLQRETGIDIGFRNCGATYIAYQDNLEKLIKAAEFHRLSGWQVEWMEPAELRLFEPNLSDEVAAAYHLPQVCQVDARMTCQALAIVIRQLGGKIIEGTNVSRLVCNPSNVEIQSVDGKNWRSDILVIATGFGTNEIAGLPQGIPHSRPVRGVMLELKLPVGEQFLRCPVKQPDGVLLPLNNGNLLVGSSHKEGETELEAPASIVTAMLENATRAVPALAGLPTTKTRIGIRALVGDGLLRLGQCCENENIYFSLSHAGAGFLRAPLIASEMAKVILDSSAEPEWIAPFYKP